MEVDSSDDEDLVSPFATVGGRGAWGKGVAASATAGATLKPQMQVAQETQQQLLLKQKEKELQEKKQQVLQMLRTQEENQQQQPEKLEQTQQMQKEPQNYDGRQSRSRSPRRQGQTQLDFETGCKVRLHSLAGAAYLNGQCGVIEMFIAETKRWRVELESGQKKDIKCDNIEKITLEKPGADLNAGANLHPGCKVKLFNLKSAVDLNGKHGILDEFISATSRWRVKLNDGQSKDLKPENLELIEPEIVEVAQEKGVSLHPGCKVKLRGLKNAAELNGQEGILEVFIETTMRWRVKLDSGNCKDLKPDNLEMLEPEVIEESEPCPPATTCPGQSAAPEEQEEHPQNQPPDVGFESEHPQEHEEAGMDDDEKYESFLKDGTGIYMICDPGTRLNSGPSLSDSYVAYLEGRTSVEVVEVVARKDLKRIRARITEPPGWITIIDIEDGHRFAIKDANALTTEAQRPEYNGSGVDLKPGDICGPDGRFVILDFLGEGGFSTVWRCRDRLLQVEYACKFTRANAVKRQALEQEIKFMNHLSTRANKWDPEGSKHLLCLAFLEGFEHKGHLGVMFESMKYNLLTALERHGRGCGLPLLPTVRNFARHLLLALRALRQASVVHSDIKAENLLVSKDGSVVKLADFGNAMVVTEVAKVVNENLMPRFYRAPEVILGQTLGTAIDMWGAGATIYQMATDRFLFCGDTNNEVLNEMFMLCGALPAGMMTLGRYADKHFDAAGNFLYQSSTSFTMRKYPMASFNPPRRPLKQLLETLLTRPPPDVPQLRHEFLVNHFGDLISSCLQLDPESRVLPQDAVNHRFFQKQAGDMFADLDALWAENDTSGEKLETGGF